MGEIRKPWRAPHHVNRPLASEEIRQFRVEIMAEIMADLCCVYLDNREFPWKEGRHGDEK